MRIAFAVPFASGLTTAPEESVERFPLLRELPREVAELGHRVRVLLHGWDRSWFRRDGVIYEVHPPGWLLRRTGSLLNATRPRYGPAYYEPNWRMALRLARLEPDVIHAFGLTLDLQLALIARAAEHARARLVVHYHGGLPACSGPLLRIQQHNLSRVDRALFTAREQARPWFDAGLLCPDQVGQVLETSSPFRGLLREQARRITGMSGDPVCLSAGRLHPIKDPLTMLEGFARISDERPDARLYLYYLTGEMEAELRAFVDARPELAARVAFRGRAAPDEMEAIYSSADFLLQASTREWSGLAVLEAMSCGCIPVVSDIPSFTAMTGGGRFGRHFATGDAGELARAVLELANDGDARSRLSAEVQAHFQRELSFSAMARQLDIVYRSLA